MFELVGVIVLTLIPLAVSGWFVAMLFMQGAWGGFATLSKGDWAIVFVLAVTQVIMWWGWWAFVGSAVHIAVGIS